MKKFLPLFLLIFLFTITGCSTTSKEKIPSLDADGKIVTQEQAIQPPDTSPELQNIADEDLVDYVQKNGIVFAKTDFQGVLKTRYVRLLLEDIEDPTHQFQLHIGEQSASFFGCIDLRD